MIHRIKEILNQENATITSSSTKDNNNHKHFCTGCAIVSNIPLVFLPILARRYPNITRKSLNLTYGISGVGLCANNYRNYLLYQKDREVSSQKVQIEQ